MPENKNFKITIVSNAEKKQIDVKFSPRLVHSIHEEIQQHLNTLLTGTEVGINALLQHIETLRPATEAEVNAKVYVFKTDEDYKLYTSRKVLRDGLADIFQTMLRNLFPDVDYIAGSIEYQQELVTRMTPEEASDYKKEVEAIAEKVKQKEA